MLMIKELTKTYPNGRHALRGITFYLEAEERVVLLGPNGAGKTTLVKCITGLLQPDSGQIMIRGRDVVQSPNDARDAVAVVFEEADNSYAYLTVYENLRYFSLLNGWSTKEVGTRAKEVLDLVGLTGREHDPVQSLSRGMKQKLAIAISFMKGAPLLFLDEPTLGLDVESQHQMRNLLRGQHSWWQSFLVTTHDVAFAHAVGTRFVFMKEGRIIWEGEPQDVPTVASLESCFLSAIAE